MSLNSNPNHGSGRNVSCEDQVFDFCKEACRLALPANFSFMLKKFCCHISSVKRVEIGGNDELNKMYGHVECQRDDKSRCKLHLCRDLSQENIVVKPLL